MQSATPAAGQAPGSSVWHALVERLDRAVQPRYRVLRLLGYGGMAGVYLADEPRLGRRVAIKVMAPGLMVDPAFVGRFEQEARTIAQLNHANVVTVFDVDDRDGLHYFVMEYVPGRTLGQMMAQREEPLEVRAIEHWFAQAASALGYAHRAGIVHRDVKPGNILIDGNGNALVTDFGIAKVADEPSLTRTGLLVGTPAYMSPEQCLGSPVTGASDQYSLGIVMYELLTGAPPFTGQTVGILHAHVHEPPRPVRELRPDCPPGLAAALERMLRKQVAERFDSMAQAVNASGATPLPEVHPLRDELAFLGAMPERVDVRGAARLTAGEATRLTAVPRDTAGRPLGERAVSWVSETPAIAAIDEEGVLYALAPGTVRVAAWCEGVVGVATIEVAAGELPVELRSPRTLLQPGEQVELDARIQGERPSALHWSTSDPRIAQVDAGRVVALSPGTVTITASTGEHFASATLTVAGAAAVGPAVTPAALTPAAGIATTPAAVAAGASAGAMPAEPRVARPAAARASRRRRLPPAAVAGLVLLVGAAALMLLLPRGDGAPVDAAMDASAREPLAGDPAAPDAVPPAVAGGAAIDSPAIVENVAATAARADSPAAPPERTAGGDRGAAPGTPATTARTPAPVVPEPPRTGTLRIAGSLPTGAEVTVTGPGGTRPVTGGTIALPAGAYRVDAQAPGYRPARHEIELAAGETETWAPALQALEPERPAAQNAPATPPVTAPNRASTAAAEAEVRTALTGFVAALATRDMDALAGRYPGTGGAWRRQWGPFFENDRDVRNLSTRLLEVNRLELAGDVARVAFTVQMVYDDFRNRRQEPRFDFQATFRRAQDGWTLTELNQTS